MDILDEYRNHKNEYRINRALLWDFDYDNFDWQRLKATVIRRVIERGRKEDYFAAFDLYGGREGFREGIKEVSSLSDKDMNFVCIIFDLKKEELTCYKKRWQGKSCLNNGLWNHKRCLTSKKCDATNKNCRSKNFTITERVAGETLHVRLQISRRHGTFFI